MQRSILLLALAAAACGDDKKHEPPAPPPPALTPGAYEVTCDFGPTPTVATWTVALTGSYYTVAVERSVTMGGVADPGGHLILSASVEGENCESIYMVDLVPSGDSFTGYFIDPVAECETSGFVVKVPCTGALR